MKIIHKKFKGRVLFYCAIMSLCCFVACSKKTVGGEDPAQALSSHVEPELTTEAANNILHKSESYGLETNLYAVNALSRGLASDGKNFTTLLECSQNKKVRIQIAAACLLSLGKTPIESLTLESRNKLHLLLIDQLAKDPSKLRLAAAITLYKLPELLQAPDWNILIQKLPVLSKVDLTTQLVLLSFAQKLLPAQLSSQSEGDAKIISNVLSADKLNPYALAIGITLLAKINKTEFVNWKTAICPNLNIKTSKFQCWRTMSALAGSLQFQDFSATATVEDENWPDYEKLEPLNAKMIESELK